MLSHNAYPSTYLPKQGIYSNRRTENPSKQLFNFFSMLLTLSICRYGPAIAKNKNEKYPTIVIFL